MLSKFFGVESHFKEWKLNQSWKRVAQFSIFENEISLFRVTVYSKSFREYIWMLKRKKVKMLGTKSTSKANKWRNVDWCREQKLIINTWLMDSFWTNVKGALATQVLYLKYFLKWNVI